MIASAVLLNVHTAVWAWLCSHGFDSRHRHFILCLFRLIASAFPMRRPWPITLQADFVVTVGACDPLLATLGFVAVFDGEV
jgi:hypothetical protein